ncbi:MAG: GTPase Era [Thermoleophilia bacterium]|jgi:GTPase|nr:GTPase Era [Thermoleophilia bacterium]
MTPLHSGLVALAGRPNVGKSTLANALAGAHVAAVSDRPQTTRRRVLAVARGEGWQAVLLDLPGFQRPADRLTERMQDTVDRTVGDTDAALFLLNAAEEVGKGDRFIAHRLKASGLPVVIVVNQVDRVEADVVARVILQASELLPDFVALHPVSALTGEGLDALREEFPALLPEGPSYFPDGVSTDQTQEEMAAEMIREAAIQRMRDEIPHALAVHVEDISDAKEGVRIEAYIYVEAESQKGIVVGKGGTMIRDIGTQARMVLADFFKQPVHLNLQVKVRPRWRRDDAMLDRLGL